MPLLHNTISKIRNKTSEAGASSTLVTSLPDVRWACGFTGSNGILIVHESEAHFVTDGRYTEQARAEIDDAVEVHVASSNLHAHASENDLIPPRTSVAFQSDHVTVSELESWKEAYEDVNFVPVASMLTKSRGVKDAGEIESIAAAQTVTDAVFQEIITLIEPGMTEKDVAAEITYRHLRRGAEKMSFDPIVASGPNSALPHARPTLRKIRTGDVVVIDMGCFLEGYASDMTRTIAIGEAPGRFREVYDAVLRAQEAALDGARAGLRTDELDALSRDVLEEEGLADNFSHGLGHGVGLEIHEWPRVSYRSEDELPAGAVVTIEPGVYLSGEFGIRIEDIIALEEDGNRNLTGTGKELVVV
jgi:Xaa-Pro aminopeptidase